MTTHYSRTAIYVALASTLRPAGIICTAVLIAACANELSAPLPKAAPTIISLDVAAHFENVLSAVVSVHVRDADSVAVYFTLGDVASAGDSLAPAVKTVGDSATIPLLGLLPARYYLVRAIAYGPGGNTIGKVTELTTDTLPPDLPHYTASGLDPSPGYVVFAAGRYGVVIDNTGRVVWYYRFPIGSGLNFMAQPDGGYVARPTTSAPSISDPWVEIDPLGNVTRNLGCALGLQSRPHDLIIDREDGYWLLCDEVRTMDLSNAGGVVGARVTGTVIQHLDKTGKLLFSWSAFDHFDITDGEPADRKGANVNWTHGNALDLDADGNLLVSFRNLNEITKIDAVSGAVIWRMGGRRNQFVFVNSPSPAFMGQHSVRVSKPGGLIILDNTGSSQSIAEQYTFDETSKTAVLAHSYSSAPGVVTQIGGSVQRMAGGRVLVSFGTAGRVEEYDADGRVVWRIEGNPGYVFRAQRIRSLYAPTVETR
jgi:hypothetical protein